MSTRRHSNATRRLLGRSAFWVGNSEYWLCNNGDLTMFTATLDRIHQRWLDARIAVLTDSPCLLRAYFPRAEGISISDEDPWALPMRLERRTPRPAGGGTGRPGPTAPTRMTQVAGGPSAGRPPQAGPVGTTAPCACRRPRQRNHATANGPLRTEERSRCGAVFASGGPRRRVPHGRRPDPDHASAPPGSTRLRRGRPGGARRAGTGPLDDPGLQARAAQVLPRDRAGAAAERVLVTGNDAIELGYHAPIDEVGSDIGFCLRVAGYAPVSAGVADLIARAACSAAAERTAALVPLIIAEYRSQNRRSTLALVRGCADVIAPLPPYVHPIEIVGRVARCRVVVTGAYHLAVFALSQGVPVVALRSTAYYDDKFLRLSVMFGQGLTLVRLDGPCLEQTLAMAIDREWRTAPVVREPLCARARMKVDARRAAFNRVATLTQACATAQVALPSDHLRSAADPAWLPTADEGATAGTDPPT